MPYFSLAVVIGAWMGLISVVLVSLTALVRDPHFAADLELSLAVLCALVALVSAVAELCFGGPTALSMFIGSLVVSLVLSVSVVRLIVTALSRLTSRRFLRTATTHSS